MKEKLLKHGITGAVCLALAAVYALTRDFAVLGQVAKFRILCDAFTIPGILCLCVGALLWVSNDGFFYGLSYCLEIAWKALIPGGRRKMEKYYDYVTRKKEKKITGYGFLFAWGGACMALAILFMILFYHLYR